MSLNIFNRRLVVAGIVADGTPVTLNGTAAVTVDNNGSVAGVVGTGTKGSYGIVVKGTSGKFEGTGTTANIKVTTDKSVGLYSENVLKVNTANVTATDGAINFYAKGGTIEVTNGGTTETGQKSLLFYTSNNGTIKLSGGTLNATINTRGTVISVTDGIVRVHGLSDVMQGEMLEFPNNTFGLAMNLERDSVGAVVLGEYEHIKEGDEVKCTGRILEVLIGRELVGRVVNALGQPIDGKGPIDTNYSDRKSVV